MKRIAAARGFSLIEVMIVVAVIGILASAAYPTYLSYGKRSVRSATQALMLDLANREQQYLLDNRAFIGGNTAVAALLFPGSVPADIASNYDISIAAPTEITFTITATPKTGGMMAGDGALTLDQAGTRLPAAKWEGR